ncbi:MAG: hypothetical protein NW224_25175 [Leptolyngbyaceae cyanobacterium bins.302]|nr:hypothetical protein [Leptolyngbyaceae cyanobacterium bins.302]
MVEQPQFIVPTNLSFEEALELTEAMLDRHREGAFSETALQQAVADLVAGENGARGFFVVYLSDTRSQPDALANTVIAALKTAPEVISPLLIKNLAMSTAMAISHQRNHDQDLALGSKQVQTRSLHLIQRLQTPQLKEHAIALADSLTTSSGAYATFLERWQYDPEQRQAIKQVLEQTGLL